jgi:hypothetical protein
MKHIDEEQIIEKLLDIKHEFDDNYEFILFCRKGIEYCGGIGKMNWEIDLGLKDGFSLDELVQTYVDIIRIYHEKFAGIDEVGRLKCKIAQLQKNYFEVLGWLDDIKSEVRRDGSITSERVDEIIYGD